MTLALALLLVASAPPVAYDAPPPPPRAYVLVVSSDPDAAAPGVGAKPVASPAPVLWTRVDSHGSTWTHPDRALLDAHVDAIERGFAGYLPATHSAAPAFGSCAGGTCSVGYAAPRRSTLRIFGRR